MERHQEKALVIHTYPPPPRELEGRANPHIPSPPRSWWRRGLGRGGIIILNQLKNYIHLTRLNKPIGIFLLLWPTLWALWLSAPGKPQMPILIIFILGTIVMRSAGCVMNDMADRHLDKHVARTKNRPLAAGKISLLEAVILFVTLCFIALFLVLQLNTITLLYAFIGLVLTLLYPFMKRYTHLPQVGLGMAFTWGIPVAFAAQTGHVSAIGWLLFFTAMLWPIIYDTQYAMTDREDDIKIGIKSTAILFGAHDKLIIGILQALFLLALIAVGFVFELGILYYGCLGVAGVLFTYQQFLMKDRDPAQCFKAFLNNNLVGLIIFLGIAV